MTIDISVLTANAGKLNKCLKKSEANEQDAKDRLLYNTVTAKVTKEKHHTWQNPLKIDGTIEKCIALLRDGANLSKLQLSEKDLEILSITQKAYYATFIRKLHKQIESKEKKATSKSERTNCNATTHGHVDNSDEESRDSDAESGYGSDGNSITSDGEHSDDITPLIAQPNSKNTHFEESKSKGKTPNAKKKFIGFCVRRMGRGTSIRFEPFNKSGKSGVGRTIKSTRQSIRQFFAGKNKTIIQPDENPHYDLTNTGNENNSSATNESVKTQISNEIKDDSNGLLEAIKHREQEKFKNHLESVADTNTQDEEGNNILHRIASLKKKQKCEFLDELVKCQKTSQENLAQLINCQNKDGNAPLQIALIAKIEKEDHKSHKPRDSDNTLKFLSRLLELGADPNQLELPEGSLKKLPETKKNYYRHFLKKLDELLKKSEFNQEIINKVIIKIAQIVEGGYPLHSAVRDHEKNKFNELLRRDYDITTQDSDGNAVLHYAIKLEKAIRYDFTRLILKNNKELLNAKNNNELTPIYTLLELIHKKNEDRSCTDKKFEETGRYKILKLLLESGTDITTQDNKGNNVLHRIASLKGEQKVTCLKLIVNLVEKDEFSEAANATNEEKRTPIQVALIAKTTKDKHNLVNPKSRDNTVKFCVKLLNSGVDSKQLISPKSLWNKEYYKTIKGIEKSIGRSLISDDIRTELKCNFGKKLKAHDILKYVNNVVCKVVITLVFAALASAAIFGASQGSITIATALSIVAAIGVCYIIYLKSENIYERFKQNREKSTAKEEVTPQDNTPTEDADLMQHNHSDENIEKKNENQAIQELSEQPECTETPNTRIDNPSAIRQFMNSITRCLGFSTG